MSGGCLFPGGIRTGRVLAVWGFVLGCAVLACSLLGSGCSGVSDRVKDTAETVLTLRSGTMSDLRLRVGDGPFTTYDVPPEEMLTVVEEAARSARGRGGRPVAGIFVSELRGEVVAKERPPDKAHEDGYADPFLSAMVATVRPVTNRPDVSSVEIHAIRSGPFHRGVVAWERDMPRWIGAVLRARRAVADAPLAPIPAPQDAPQEPPLRRIP